MKQQFQQFFNNDFSDYSDFLSKVLFPVFGGDNFEEGYDVLTNEPDIKQKAAEAHIEEIKHVGTFSTDLAADIKLFDVIVSDHCQINRSRINIQQLIRRYVDTFEGAFMVFHYRNPENRSWRFSYVEKRTSGTDSTSAKRYTYLFGKTFACRTAAQRFNELYKLQQNITLQDITDAFSVEALSDEFFERYRNLYADFIQFISGKRYEKEKGKWVEKIKHAPDAQFETAFAGNDKAVRDYVKKMMGRLVFLQFLQKKGWLAVPADKLWGEGDTNYTQNLFANSDKKDDFLEAVLEPLFFDTLNSERQNDIADPILGDNIKIPYLNGGLFEKDELDEKVVVFPVEYFQNLFDFFGEYNFTIDENDPNDAELGVDPEMLGRIFENLLEDNKDKGAYYTPKEIVQYMCAESLMAYLSSDNEIDKDLIRELVSQHKADNLPEQLKNTLDHKLRNVKVCDPAIGSGAFPMGMMNQIFKCRMAIEGKADNAVDIKKHIIQNNIYGVDIENGAVDIARLRFWLALVVDETEPKPLPNLDYKIMQGNSLLESFEGVDFSQLTKITKERGEHYSLSIFDSELDLLRKNLSDKIYAYFGCNKHEQKQQLKAEITDNILTQIKQDNLNIDLSGIDISGNSEFFLWHTFFADVFDQGGFDIVIGNPPYVEAKKLKTIASKLKKYDVATGTSDLSVYFLENGLNLCKENAYLCYITTNKFFNTGYGKPVRKFILNNQINQIIDFEQVEVFEDILVSSVIIGVKKTPEIIDKFTYQKFYKLKKIDFKNQFVSNQLNFGKYETRFLSEEEWSFADKRNILLKEKVEKAGTKVCNLDGVAVFRGVTTGYNPAFIIDSDKKRELITADKNNEQIIKPLLQGRNIRKWIYNYNSESLIFIPWHFPLHLDASITGASELSEKKMQSGYPSLYNHLLEYQTDLSNRNQVETGVRYEWYALQRCAASYYPEFEKEEKIIWGLTADKWAFAYDNKQHYLPSNGYILTSENIPVKYLLALLNSKVLKYYFGFIGVMTAGGAYTLKHATIQQLPVVIADNQQPIITLVDYILYLKNAENPPVSNMVSNEVMASYFEKIIDACVYELYLEDEIKSAQVDVLELVEQALNDVSLLPIEQQILRLYEKWNEYKNDIRNRIILQETRSESVAQIIKSIAK